MTLTAHIVTGAALSTLMPEHPVLGFCAGFASHFVIDAIPHYDYPLYSKSVDPAIESPMRFDGALMRDTLDIGFDMSAGIALSLFFFGAAGGLAAILAGGFGGLLPDVLLFLRAHWKHEPVLSLARFHNWVHTPWHMRESGHLISGVASQLFFLAAVIILWQLPH